MRILIIVPTNESFSKLDRIVNSIQRQTYKNWHLLFIDGYSTKEHINRLKYYSSLDKRISWQYQTKESRKIYGAMNSGFNEALPDDWLLFWGSDDWASSPDAFSSLIKVINNSDLDLPGLVISHGQYYDYSSLTPTRSSSFGFIRNTKNVVLKSFRKNLFLGLVPMHQATLFGPKAINLLSRYDDKLDLAADLDYFLKISKNESLTVLYTKLNLVCLGEGGVSKRKHSLRFREVIKVYYRSFRIFFIIPFLLRYLQRIISLIT